MNKKSNGKRYVIVVPETLHYRLRQTALKEKAKLAEFVQNLLWEALKAR